MSKSSFDVSKLYSLNEGEISKLSENLYLDREDGVTFRLRTTGIKKVVTKALEWRIGKLVSVWGHNESVAIQVGTGNATEDEFRFCFPILIKTKQWFIPLKKITEEKWITNYSELASRGVTIEDIKKAILINFETPFVISEWFNIDTEALVDNTETTTSRLLQESSDRPGWWNEM